MTDVTSQTATTDDALPGAEVAMLASRALAVLAARAGPKPDRLVERLRLLSDAMLEDDPMVGHDALLMVRRDGISASDVIDHILPEVARLLGDRWLADEISFADVSIGVARLQEAVRSQRLDGPQSASAPAAGARVLMVVPRPEEHTMGIFVAADQLRRLGCHLEFEIGPHPRALAQTVRHGAFRAVCITASGRRSLASVKELVDTVRASAPRFTPVLLGGPVASAGYDVMRVTGVNLVSSDVRSAMVHAGVIERSAIEAETGSGKT